MVEDVFAGGMALQIERHGTQQRAIRGLEEERTGAPARAPADAAGLLQRRQEVMGEKRVVAAGAGIPGLGIERRDAFAQAQAWLTAAVRHGAWRRSGSRGIESCLRGAAARVSGPAACYYLVAGP